MMIGRNKLIWILIALVVIALGYLLYGYASTHPSKETINLITQPYIDQIAEKDELIKQKEEALKLSEAKYKYIVDKLKKKAQELNNIKQPETVSEMRKRYEEAGFPTITGK